MLTGAKGGEFKEFMSGITYILPVLQKLDIPLEDFLKKWMDNK